MADRVINVESLGERWVEDRLWGSTLVAIQLLLLDDEPGFGLLLLTHRSCLLKRGEWWAPHEGACDARKCVGELKTNVRHSSTQTQRDSLRSSLHYVYSEIRKQGVCASTRDRVSVEHP